MKRSTWTLLSFSLFSITLLMACHSSKDAANGTPTDDLDNVESIGIEADRSDSDGFAYASDSGGEGHSGRQENASQPKGGLQGSWAWIKTACCGRMMGETYPAENEPRRIISFTDAGRATYFTDASKEKTSNVPYTISKLGPGQPTVKIGELQPAIFAVSNDTLILSWGYMDLQIEYYERVKE